MARITVVGGTGYAGSGIVAAAVGKGHEVTSYSRNLPEQQIDGVTYKVGSVVEEPVARAAVAGADVVVVAVSPRGDMEGRVADAVAQLAGIAQESGVRLGVIGGAGSLHVADGGPRLSDTEGFPDVFKAEAAEMAGVLDSLRAWDQSLDWFFVSPAAGFGAYAPGETTGEYRIGGDVLLTDADGDSKLSNGDLGLAVVAEVEEPAYRRARLTVAY